MLHVHACIHVDSYCTTCLDTFCISPQLIYCLAHFKGDEKIPPYIHRLIDPSEITEVGNDAEPSQFTEDDYLALLSKNSETLFQDEGYMKHLRRHAHKSATICNHMHI